MEYIWSSVMDACHAKSGALDGATMALRSANLEQWVFGYLTSLNRWVPGIVNIARGSNHEGLALWVDHYCSENPEKDVADAGYEMGRIFIPCFAKEPRALK